MAIYGDTQYPDRAWMLGHYDEGGGFLLEPAFVSTADFTTWCVRPTLDLVAVCGRPVATNFLGEEAPDLLGNRDVITTCVDCGLALAAQGRAREVDPRVAVTASRYFWQVQQQRSDLGLPEQAVTA